jgi:rsbT antagonist protein RsbS
MSGMLNHVQGMHLTPLGDGHILLEPSLGLDISSPEDHIAQLMDVLQRKQATCLIYDMSSISIIDDVYYAWLKRISSLCHLGGQNMVVVNVQPTAAFSLSTLLDECPPFDCAIDVDQARQLKFDT